ncbi:hypothetical protein N9T60_02495 [Candidatus Actinomarina]|nr:hypothetical protein [Candidatus Actinomarina sp.]
MSKKQVKNDWDITRCSKPFCCQEDAEEYMTSRNLDGMVLELNDGTIQAVCPTYPADYYSGAKTLSKINTKESCCDISG